jgi:hypothetical protein
MFTIETITAFVSVDKDGEEGIIGQLIDGAWMPFVCADEERFNRIFPMCKEFCEKTGVKFKILRFSTRTDITSEYIP